MLDYLYLDLRSNEDYTKRIIGDARQTHEVQPTHEVLKQEGETCISQKISQAI